MRKLTCILALLLGSITSNTFAQQISILNGSTVISGITVTVTPSSPPPNSATQCNTGPYQIGKNYSDGYTYSFTPAVTHFSLEMIRLHNDDTVQVSINGTGRNVSVWTPYAGGNCNLTSTGFVFPGNGLITTTGGATGPGQALQFELTAPTPNLITTVEVRHIRAANNNLASDVIYNAYFKDDTCALPFIAEADSPICAGEDLQLTVTNYPNTTYKWSTTAIPPVFSPSVDVREPILKNISPINTGQYFVVGTRGICTYNAMVDISISPAPSIGNVMQIGPLCPGGDDTMFVPTVNLPTGGTVYGWNKTLGTVATFNVLLGYAIPFPSVQITDRALYGIYAVDVQGCTTDTTDFYFDVLAGVAAGFTYNVIEGCDADSVIFTNTSVDNNTQSWTFGDNTPGSTDKDPVHAYIVPKPNDKARTYTARLIIGNASCADTVEHDIIIDHPLIPKFFISDDSICQGGNIIFSDSSRVKPGTIPVSMWDLGYGDFKQIVSLEHEHQYNVAGIYHPKLVLTDFLGCVDSYSLELVVDSVGGITFKTDRENVCLGEEITFTGEYYEGGANSVQWNFNDGVITPDARLVYHSYKEAGTYNVTYDIDYRICPDLTFSKDVVVKPFPSIYLGEDTAICLNGEPIYIGDLVNTNNTNGITYSWNTTTKDVSKGIYVRHPGKYAVTASLDGCTASDTVEVKKNCYINIPNAFTPNGDGSSDYFLPRQILSRNVSEFSMQIYNRWGAQVFATTATNGRGWDGRYNGEEQPVGVYVYTIQVTFGNGVTERYQGNVTLLK